MPWYDVEHVAPLSTAQCDSLAQKITDIHTSMFAVPSFLMNIQFHDASTHNTYVAGKRRLSNRIKANVRVGASRPTKMFDDLAERLEKAWYEVMGTGPGMELRCVLINGGRVAGREAGFVISAAGQEASWMQENLPVIDRRAKEGDGEMKDLLEELRTRDDLRN